MRRIALALVVLAGLLATAGAKKVKEPDPADSERAPTAGEDAEAAPADAPAVGSAEVPASQRPATPPGPFPLPENLPDKARFVVVELHDEVSLGMAAFVERVANHLERDDILVLDINTFGGRVDAAVRIRDALLHVDDRGAYAVAWVNPRAISAGALIAYASHVIVAAPASTMGAATPIQIEGGKPTSVSEKMISYWREEMRATAEARGRRGDLAAAMVDPYVEVDGLDDRGKTLTVEGANMVQWGVASYEARDFDALLRGLGYGGEGGKPYEVVKVHWSWAENVAGWLSSSEISGLLMALGMLGLMIGLYTGGSPIPLALGGSCLALFFFGHHIVNLAGIEDILLFLAGLGLIAFEAFVPGHIVPGVLGILCIVAALFLGLLDLDKVDFGILWEAGYVGRALTTVFGSIFATILLGFAAYKFLPATRLGRGLQLRTRIEARAADKAATSAAGVVGERGTVVTKLRPSGKVKIGDRRYDAVAERGFIEEGTAVEVIRRDGFHIVVAAVGGAPKEEPEES